MEGVGSEGEDAPELRESEEVTGLLVELLPCFGGALPYFGGAAPLFWIILDVVSAWGRIARYEHRREEDTGGRACCVGFDR